MNMTQSKEEWLMIKANDVDDIAIYALAKGMGIKRQEEEGIESFIIRMRGIFDLISHNNLQWSDATFLDMIIDNMDGEYISKEELKKYYPSGYEYEGE